MSISTTLSQVSVGILLFDGVDELDFVGPFEVFANASNEQGQPCCQVFTIGKNREIRGQKHLQFACDYLLEDCPHLDLLVVPGGAGAMPGAESIQDLVSFLKRQHEKGITISSVCVGSFLLAAADLLDQRRATTHTGFQQQLQQTYPSIQVLADKVIDEEDILTSGGVVSGIDLALHCLEKWFGPAARQRAARRLDGPWI